MKCSAIEAEIYTAAPAPAPFSSGLRIPVAPGPKQDTLQYIPANRLLTVSDPQSLTNKTIDCNLNTCLSFPGGGSSGFPVTIGSTAIPPFGAVTSISGLTLVSPGLTGMVSGSPNFTGQPILSGLPSGTCSVGVALDSGNHLVTTACGSGGSGITQLLGSVTTPAGSGPQTATITATGVTAGSYTVSDGSSQFCWIVSASGQVTSIVSGACGAGTPTLTADDGTTVLTADDGVTPLTAL